MMHRLRWLRLGSLASMVLALGLGCGQRQSPLLVVYSGECEAYLEPCG